MTKNIEDLRKAWQVEIDRLEREMDKAEATYEKAKRAFYSALAKRGNAERALQIGPVAIKREQDVDGFYGEER